MAYFNSKSGAHSAREADAVFHALENGQEKSSKVWMAARIQPDVRPTGRARKRITPSRPGFTDCAPPERLAKARAEAWLAF
jgi:hypothetical protein